MWRDASKRQEAARAMKITAPDLKQLGLVDLLVTEPPGGAQTDHGEAGRLLSEVLQANLAELRGIPPRELVARRYEKFRVMTNFFNEIR
jgi:acetyl-CoA carboxylase carboxyl transferase subunit alpha